MLTFLTRQRPLVAVVINTAAKEDVVVEVIGRSIKSEMSV